MSSSFQSNPASASAPTHAHTAAVGLPNGLDEVALGWECADPALQIDSWGREAAEIPDPGTVKA